MIYTVISIVFIILIHSFMNSIVIWQKLQVLRSWKKLSNKSKINCVTGFILQDLHHTMVSPEWIDVVKWVSTIHHYKLLGGKMV